MDSSDHTLKNAGRVLARLGRRPAAAGALIVVVLGLVGFGLLTRPRPRAEMARARVEQGRKGVEPAGAEQVRKEAETAHPPAEGQKAKAAAPPQTPDLQAQLIFPGHATQGQPTAVVKPGPDAALVDLSTSAGERIVALFGPALRPDGTPHPAPAARPTLLFFYGNGMCLRAATGLFERFRRLGANVLIPEYVGYGMSTGEPSEAGCYATADAAYAYLLTRKDVDPARIVIAGWSLGSAVAVDLAARKPAAGLALFSPFTSMTDMAERSFPFLPVALLLRYRFPSAAKIGRVRCPVLIAHGTDDQLVPPEMADRLAAAAGGRVTSVRVQGAGHNDLFAAGGDRVLPALQSFLARVAPDPAAGGLPGR
jgi:fermentation-respiration switch protein FrsA (DUF1100 family)